MKHNSRILSILTTATMLVFIAILWSCSKVELPELSTNDITQVTLNSATSGGKITDDGGAEITAKGVVWGKSQDPTLDKNDGKTSDGTGSGNFTSEITGLDPATTYYVRAYATNSEGTAYGNQRSFMTIDPETFTPTVTTDDVTNIGFDAATCGGNVLSDGGYDVTARGVVWSTSANPTIEDNDGITNNGDGTGEYTSQLTGLTNGTKYYVRAYATNSMGTSYGDEKEFTTDLGLATVTTTDITDVKSTIATGGGNVTHIGVSSVTARGVVWKTTANPTIEDNDGFTTDGTGTGNFASNLSGLQSATTYYVKAYATNSAGTSYGNQVTFTTFPGGTVTDVEGNVYQTVIIGSQEWTVENLRVTKYNNGDDIITGLDNLNWQMTDQGAYAIYPFADVSGISTDEQMLQAYGALYNWNATNDSRGLCPAGWRVPTDEDWNILIEHIDIAAIPNAIGVQSDFAGGVLKSTRSGNHPKWDNPNTGATNEKGFHALPGGLRINTGFGYIGEYANFWSSIGGGDNAFMRMLSFDNANIDRYELPKFYGFSIRCVKE